MDSPQEHRRVGRAKRGSTSNAGDGTAYGEVAVIPSAPCGACKFLRRKCAIGCIFAPHFGSDQGAARFAAVHKVFGASNVSKLLSHIPDNKRHEAVLTIWYEAQARLSDPVYGCVSKIAALQQQVQALQTELSVVQNQLMSSRFAMANAYQNPQQQQQQQQHIPMGTSYSNASSASNNFMNFNNFNPNFDETATRSSSFEPNLSHLVQPLQDEEDNGSHDPAAAFANFIFN